MRPVLPLLLASLSGFCGSPVEVATPGVTLGGQEATRDADGASPPTDSQEEEPRRILPGRTDAPDTLPFETAQTNYVLEHAVVQASPRTALLFYDHCGAHRGTVLRDLLIHVAPGVLPKDRSYWGVRGYDMVDTLLDQVEVTGFGRITSDHDEGHALYFNPAGNLSLVDCYIHGNGGQGAQIVNRPHESVFLRGPAAGTILVRRTRFIDNGFNPDRGAFQLSIFGTGQDVLIEDSRIEAGFEPELWPAGDSRGALLIEPEPWLPEENIDPWWRPVEPPDDFEIPFTQGRVELRGLVVRHRSPDRPILQIKGCRELIVTGCDFGNGGEGPLPRVELDLPNKPGRNSGRIVWKGNRGNASVSVRGELRGPASLDFEIE